MRYKKNKGANKAIVHLVAGDIYDKSVSCLRVAEQQFELVTRHSARGTTALIGTPGRYGHIEINLSQLLCPCQSCPLEALAQFR